MQYDRRRGRSPIAEDANLRRADAGEWDDRVVEADRSKRADAGREGEEAASRALEAPEAPASRGTVGRLAHAWSGPHGGQAARPGHGAISARLAAVRP